MNKIIAGILLASTATVFCASNESKGHKAISSEFQTAYNNTFGKGNLILQPITVDQNKEWQTFLTNAELYIKTNNPLLSKDFDTLKKGSLRIIADLQNMYYSAVANGFTDPKLKETGTPSYTLSKGKIDSSKIDRAMIATTIISLTQATQPQITKEIKELTQAVKEPADPRPAQLLLNFATLLNGVIEKAKTDEDAFIKQIGETKTTVQSK